jgi:hypothetical protein
MTEDGYEECGRSLAAAVVSGYKSLGWAAEIGAVLGYNRKHVKAWIERYTREHKAEIEREARKKRRAERRRLRLDKAVQEVMLREPLDG